jgi:phosphoserine phosphatase
MVNPDSTPLLLTVTGPDAPGAAAAVFDSLSGLPLEVLDIEQVHIHGRLLLGVVLSGAGVAPSAILEAVNDPRATLAAFGLTLELEPLETPATTSRGAQQLVTVLGKDLGPARLAEVFRLTCAAGANVDRIVRLSRYPVTSYELTVSVPDPAALRAGLVARAAALQVDVAVQPSGLHRRAKRLIVLDVDSTLIQGEVIDLLAAEAGREEEVAALTAAAMAGELDFETALRRRVAALAGLDVAALARVRDAIVLTPGARTLIRTLRRLGYVTAIVSGGFRQITDDLARQLGIDHAAANTLEIREGRLTGGLLPPIIDRSGKAAALVRFAEAAGVPLAQTVAVGDGANDLDMLSTAGLGIAFNAKAVLREAADATINVPYLDAILFLLGVSREEIEAADAEETRRTTPPDSGPNLDPSTSG